MAWLDGCSWFQSLIYLLLSLISPLAHTHHEERIRSPIPNYLPYSAYSILWFYLCYSRQHNELLQRRLQLFTPSSIKLDPTSPSLTRVPTNSLRFAILPHQQSASYWTLELVHSPQTSQFPLLRLPSAFMHGGSNKPRVHQPLFPPPTPKLSQDVYHTLVCGLILVPDHGLTTPRPITPTKPVSRVQLAVATLAKSLFLLTFSCSTINALLRTCTRLANYRNWIHLRGSSMKLPYLASLRGSIYSFSTLRQTLLRLHSHSCWLSP